jgi:hypothetical protein
MPQKPQVRAKKKRRDARRLEAWRQKQEAARRAAEAGGEKKS